MIKLFLLVAFFFVNSYSLKAGEVMSDDRDFMEKINIIKDPFEEGLPKPIEAVQKPVYHAPAPVLVKPPKPKPKRAAAPPEIKLPELKLQGVIVGEDVHEAIIDDTVVPLQGIIQDARVDSVTKDGVELLYKGKKFFLKVE
jgi:hypothetical protein